MPTFSNPANSTSPKNRRTKVSEKRKFNHQKVKKKFVFNRANKWSKSQADELRAANEDSTLISMKGETYKFVVSRDPTRYEPVRDRIRSQINKRFDGWSDEYDRQFDKSAIFFLLTDLDGNLFAGIRLVMSDTNGVEVPVSKNDRGCLINFDGAFEYSGLWFAKLSHCLALSGMMSDWVDRRFQSKDIFVVFEASSRPMRRIYLKSLGGEEIDHPAIAYDGFSYKESGESVQWQLAVCRANSRRIRSDRYLSSAGAQKL